MDLGVTDKLAVISGGNKGLGAAAAGALAGEGANVFLSARGEGELKTVSADMESSHGVQAGILAIDITEVGAGDKIIAGALQQFGQVDIVVNGAFLALNKGLSQQYGPDGIFVNAVDPGPTRSERVLRLFAEMAEANGTTPEELEIGFGEQIPIGRLGEMDEVARIVAFLASDASGNVNGAVVTVDGGMTRGLF